MGWSPSPPRFPPLVTVTDTVYDVCAQLQACAAADAASGNKVTKYTHLAITRVFVPSAEITIGGSWNAQAVESVQGKRICEVTNEPRHTQYLFQRL